MNQQTETLDLEGRISEADALHVQAHAIVDLIGRSKGTDCNDRTIINASWCVETLLDRLLVERRAIETVATSAVETKPTTLDGTGAIIPADHASGTFICFPTCISEAERVYDGDAKLGLEYAAPVTNSNGVTYAEAVALCRMLRIGGHRDWRVPTLEEWRALPADVTGPSLLGPYWTANAGDEPGTMTVFDPCDNGVDAPADVTTGFFVLPVRTSSSETSSRRGKRKAVRS